jgi:hypothetical protein
MDDTDRANQWERVGEYIGEQLTAEKLLDALLEQEFGLSKDSPFYWEELQAIGKAHLGLGKKKFFDGHHTSELYALLKHRVVRDKIITGSSRPYIQQRTGSDADKQLSAPAPSSRTETEALEREALYAVWRLRHPERGAQKRLLSKLGIDGSDLRRWRKREKFKDASQWSKRIVDELKK